VYFKAVEGWGHGSNRRAPAKQVQGPEFKPLYLKKKKKNIWMANRKILPDKI
jgi:hypothetical protein